MGTVVSITLGMNPAVTGGLFFLLLLVLSEALRSVVTFSPLP